MEAPLAYAERPHVLFFCHCHTLYFAVQDLTYRALLNEAGLGYGDGIGVRLAARFRGVRLAGNLNGVEELLCVRGVIVSYEAIRKWCQKLRSSRHRADPGDAGPTGSIPQDSGSRSWLRGRQLRGRRNTHRCERS